MKKMLVPPPEAEKILPDWEELEGCCGVQILFDLARESRDEICQCRDVEETGEHDWACDERVTANGVLAGMKEVIADWPNPAFRIATTIPSQKLTIAALKKCGFKPIHRGKSVKTNRVITLWAERGRRIKV